MSLSKISRLVYGTNGLSLALAITFELNQVCNAIKYLRHIHFPELTESKIGALLRMNTFHFFNPCHQCKQKQAIRVKTNLDRS